MFQLSVSLKHTAVHIKDIVSRNVLIMYRVCHFFREKISKAEKLQLHCTAETETEANNFGPGNF